MAHPKREKLNKEKSKAAFQKLTEMLDALGISFVKKSESVTLDNAPVILYFDSIGNQYKILSKKTGNEVFSTKFLGTIKDKLAQKFGLNVNMTKPEHRVRGDKQNSAGKGHITRTKSSTGESKTDLARKVFDEMFGKKGVERKHIIDEFISKVGLTKAGASTYYQNIKREKGL